MSKTSKLAALRELLPDTWATEIRNAMVISDGLIPDAALLLGVSVSTLRRWLDEEPCKNIRRAPVGRPKGGK